MLFDAVRDLFNDFKVFADQIGAVHAGLARETRRDDADIRARNIGIIIRAF